MQKGYRNESHPAVLANGQRLNLIIYKSEPQIVTRIKNSNAIGDFLHTQGLPARSTADPRILRLAAAKYAALYHYLPGETIPWEGYTQAHLKALGQAMGQMHRALQTMPPRPQLPNVAEEYEAIFARMQRYFAGPAVRQAVQAKLGLALNNGAIPRAQKLFAACWALPGQQPLHMDFVRSNVLFAVTPRAEAGAQPATAVTGIIDFEKTGQGHPALDLARTLAFLLVDCKYKDPPKIEKYFLHSGYAKRGQAHLRPSRRLLGELITAFLLHDFYKFLRHNPYESLGQNEHFVRTRKELLKRDVLAETA